MDKFRDISTLASTSQPNPQRPKVTLLPAFEPLSSSPALPRPLKRTRDEMNEDLKYPTPVPTSSTALMSSSPARQRAQRPNFIRTLSTLSERVPLSAVPSIQLSASGTPILMGRSSASSDYQLPSNRQISRVHVQACYKPALSRLERDRIEIKCLGWNGIKVHCQSQVYDLAKDELFHCDSKYTDVMVDVHDARVMVHWPEKPRLGPVSTDGEGEDNEDQASPLKRQRAMLRHSTPPSPSPVQSRRRPISPVSPSPAVQALLPSSPPLPLTSGHVPVEIYEDPESEEDDSQAAPITQSTQVLTQIEDAPSAAPDSVVSLELEAEYSENDEENDPIIHSFGPFGANLLPRMASFTTGGAASPLLGTMTGSHSTKTSRSSHTEPLQPNTSPSQPTQPPTTFDVKEHIINQLAFSRLSSTPLSTIFSHLPQDPAFTSTRNSNNNIASPSDLRDIIAELPCIGEVTREGKDAAGKVLESEFYYIPDEDEDEKRKEAVVNDLMKPGLRSCRKQHKVRSHSLLFSTSLFTVERFCIHRVGL